MMIWHLLSLPIKQEKSAGRNFMSLITPKSMMDVQDFKSLYFSRSRQILFFCTINNMFVCSFPKSSSINLTNGIRIGLLQVLWFLVNRQQDIPLFPLATGLCPLCSGVFSVWEMESSLCKFLETLWNQVFSSYITIHYLQHCFQRCRYKIVRR